LLEGLEISIIHKKNANSITGEFRIDSDYYKKHYLLNESVLHKLNTNKFHSYCDFIKKGIFDLPPSNYLTEGVPLIRTSEIKDPTINFNTTVFISETTNSENEKTILKPFDLVFTKIGAYIGDVAMLPSNYSEYNFSQNVTGSKLKEAKEGPFLLSFFLSKIGRNQILRSLMLSGQGKLELDDIRNYEIPIVSDLLKNKIKAIFDLRDEIIVQSNSNYQEAESILFKEINLTNFELSKDPINIKTLKESFGITKRLDAEYYQKKFEQIIEKIVSQKHDYLSNVVEISKSIEPGSNHYSDEKEGLPFYRVADYNKYGLSKPDKELTTSFVADNKDLIEKLKPKKDTILFSKDGSVGTAFLLRHDLDGITSSAILHLQVKNTKQILPEYLTLALNSKLVQMQAERDAGGSIILHWRKEEIEQVVVPIIDFKKQEQIAELVEESFKLKVESERLLEVAKKAVEMAIEVDEATATKFIKENTK
jgi:type I restriction enzyme S subunit